MLGLLTVMILKRVCESIFFQTNKFIACQVKDGKELDFMIFNLLNIIHQFPGKKHSRATQNLNFNPREYLVGC